MNGGVTPLFMTSQNGHLEIVRLLVEAGADKDKAGNYGVTPLQIARNKGRLEIVRLLVDAGARDCAGARDYPPLGWR